MENSSMRKTSFIRLAVAATAVAVLASTTLPANAAVKPADKAVIGDDCTAASATANKDFIADWNAPSALAAWPGPPREKYFPRANRRGAFPPPYG